MPIDSSPDSLIPGSVPVGRGDLSGLGQPLCDLLAAAGDMAASAGKAAMDASCNIASGIADSGAADALGAVAEGACHVVMAVLEGLS